MREIEAGCRALIVGCARSEHQCMVGHETTVIRRVERGEFFFAGKYVFIPLSGGVPPFWLIDTPDLGNPGMRGVIEDRFLIRIDGLVGDEEAMEFERRGTRIGSPSELVS